MGVGVRRSIILSQPLKRWLEAEAARLGIGEAELVRRILDQYREQREISCALPENHRRSG